jgi:hypothetical protein
VEVRVNEKTSASLYIISFVVSLFASPLVDSEVTAPLFRFIHYNLEKGLFGQ